MSVNDFIIYDCYMDRAQYLENDCVTVIISVSEFTDEKPVFKLYQLHRRIDCEYTIRQDKKTAEVRFELGRLPIGNYGVEISMGGKQISTSFDIVRHFSDAFRYGFLSDFSNEDAGEDDVEWLRKLHLNAVQFYDWMYKHDDLIAPVNCYNDPMGRAVQLDVIEEKIRSCKKNGMRAFAYGAVYAANKELFEQHPDWALYTMDGQPMMFFGWLYFMNISEDCAWSKYIVAEFTKAMALLGFSGIHMDTYGFPKTVWGSNGKCVPLANSFAKLINHASDAAKSIDKENGVIFNAVNNWPLESIAKSDQDAVYIEVWPPHNFYLDLYMLIREAKYLSGKNVVLAAYMEPFKNACSDREFEMAENSFLLTNAVINASGGTQLIFGEYNCILCDSYYARHARMRESFLPRVRSYSDFLVRYAPLLYGDDGMDVSKTSSNGIDSDIRFESEGMVFSSDGKPGSVWSIIRESGNRLTIHLINLTNNNGKWNEPKEEPTAINKIMIRILQDREIGGIWAASPDNDDICAKEIAFSTQKTNVGRVHSITLPSLQIWSTIWVEMM